MEKVYAILIENGRMSLFDIDEDIRETVKQIIENDGYEVGDDGRIKI